MSNVIFKKCQIGSAPRHMAKEIISEGWYLQPKLKLSPQFSNKNNQIIVKEKQNIPMKTRTHEQESAKTTAETESQRLQILNYQI